MTRQIETHQASRIIETTTTLNLVELEPDLFLYQRQVASKTTQRTNSTLRSSKADEPESRKSGFVNAAGRTQLLAGKAVSKQNEKPFVWLEPGDTEMFRQMGYPCAMDILWDRWGKNVPDPWQAWEADPDRSLDDLVFVDHSSHLMFDRNGTPLPVGLLFDYIYGRVDNFNFDLAQAFEYLRSREDVRLLRGDDKTRSGAPALDAPTTLDEAVFHIPYYNAEEGRNKALQFLWIPDAATYATVFSGKERGMRHEIVLSKDALGLRALRKTEDPYA